MTADRLVLSSRVRCGVLDHALEGVRASPPVEICGVVGGERRPDEWRATVARRVPNVAERPTDRYELDPAAAIDVIDAIEDAGRSVLGFYHSHPAGPPRPSPIDREQAAWPDHCYLVVSRPVEDPQVGAWRWTGTGFERLDVVDAGES